MKSWRIKLVLFLTIISIALSASLSPPECVKLEVEVKPRYPQLANCGTKQYYLGTFFKLNFHAALAFCKYHGMVLASIESAEENSCLINYIIKKGHFKESFWLSGTDLAQEGSFVWLSNGQPFQYSNWHGVGPNNACWDGECENCAGLWYHDNKLKFNDFKCSLPLYLICELQYQ